jgi:hypothetical protein
MLNSSDVCFKLVRTAFMDVLLKMSGAEAGYTEFKMKGLITDQAFHLPLGL